MLDPVPTMIHLPISFVVRQICAFTLMLCIVVADYVTGRDTHRRAAYALAVVASAAVVAPVESLVLLATWPEIAEMRIVSVSFFGLNLEKFAEWLILGGAATFVYTDRRRALAARARMHAAELERTHAAKRTIESRLQAMQARVEPQFLFNTLAQVHDLYRDDSDPRRADAGRTDRVSARRDAEDARHVVHGRPGDRARARLSGDRKGRLGDRLAFEIETPGEIADVRMPPMMLLPLIDHAIAHGFAASQATGTLRIHAGIADGKVRLEIADSGIGFLPESEGQGLPASASVCRRCTGRKRASCCRNVKGVQRGSDADSVRLKRVGSGAQR